MSLATDSIFIGALQQDADLMEQVGGRLYGTAIPLPDEDADNTPPPYVIVTFDGLNNQSQTKDNPYDDDEDNVQIGIEVTGETLEQLHGLTRHVRRTIGAYLSESGQDDGIYDTTFSADAIQYDPMKPCYWQVLHYQCSVQTNEEDYEQD
ncbi:MAG: hypothetical protein J1E37_06110 [Prevotella sp.]|nr:hypothetical protein [Prevotella sp.]